MCDSRYTQVVLGWIVLDVLGLWLLSVRIKMDSLLTPNYELNDDNNTTEESIISSGTSQSNQHLGRLVPR